MPNRSGRVRTYRTEPLSGPSPTTSNRPQRPSTTSTNGASPRSFSTTPRIPAKRIGWPGSPGSTLPTTSIVASIRDAATVASMSSAHIGAPVAPNATAAVVCVTRPASSTDATVSIHRSGNGNASGGNVTRTDDPSIVATKPLDGSTVDIDSGRSPFQPNPMMVSAADPATPSTTTSSGKRSVSVGDRRVSVNEGVESRSGRSKRQTDVRSPASVGYRTATSMCDRAACPRNESHGRP